MGARDDIGTDASDGILAAADSIVIGRASLAAIATDEITRYFAELSSGISLGQYEVQHIVSGILTRCESDQTAQEQATGLHQVNTAVNQMDQMTQQNAAMVEESTAASHSLAQEAEKLTSLVGQFKTGQEAPVAARRPAGAAKPRQAASRIASRPISRGNTALAMKTEAAEDSWEEF